VSDSGYASSSKTLLSPASFGPTLDLAEGDDDEGDDAAFGEGEGEGEDELAGRRLLATSPTSSSARRVDNYPTPPDSPSADHVRVIPPTPASAARIAEESDEEAELGTGSRRPSTISVEVDPYQSRRISFNGSVRIAGGIGSKSRRIPSDLFAPTPLFPIPTERTRLYQPSITSRLMTM